MKSMSFDSQLDTYVMVLCCWQSGVMKISCYTDTMDEPVLRVNDLGLFDAQPLLNPYCAPMNYLVDKSG